MCSMYPPPGIFELGQSSYGSTNMLSPGSSVSSALSVISFTASKSLKSRVFHGTVWS